MENILFAALATIGVMIMLGIGIVIGSRISMGNEEESMYRIGYVHGFHAGKRKYGVKEDDKFKNVNMMI